MLKKRTQFNFFGLILIFILVFLVFPQNSKAQAQNSSAGHLLFSEVFYDTPGTDADDFAMDFIDEANPSPGTAPVNLDEAAEITGNSAKLNWTKSLDANFFQYQILQATSSTGPTSLIITIDNLDQTQYLLSDLDPGQTYYLTIKTIALEPKKISISNQISFGTFFIPIYNVIISEILPHPATDTDDEFIELYNSGTKTIDLSGWYLDDGEGGSTPFLIPDNTQILPGRFLVFYKKETKISLNDSGDVARLLWPNFGQASSSAKYVLAPEGQSWAKSGTSWFWTTKITPNAKNIIQEIETIPTSATMLNAKKLAKGKPILVEGLVTVLPGTFSKLYFFLQDETSGIQIYFSKKLFPNLKIGDKIRVSGEISESGGEKRIKIREPGDIIILGSFGTPAAKNIKSGDVGEYSGQLVQIKGKIISSSGNTFYIDDGSGKVRIYISTSAGFKKPKMQKGDWVQITGIISKTSAGFRLMPRFLADIKIILNVQGKNTKEKTGETNQNSLLGAKTAKAAPSDLAIGTDNRVKSNGAISNLGWILAIAGSSLLIIFVGFQIWRN